MIKPRIITAILLTGGLLFTSGCANKDQQNQATSNNNQPVAQSSPTSSDTPNVSPSDQAFVTQAAQSSMAEVQIGQLAEQKATNEQVKQFAQRMVQDHTKANQELQQLAQTKNLTIPSDIGNKYQAELDQLSGLSGAEFDKAYMARMEDDHQEDIALFERQAQQGQEPNLKNWAANTLSTLQEHEKLAESVKSSVK